MWSHPTVFFHFIIFIQIYKNSRFANWELRIWINYLEKMSRKRPPAPAPTATRTPEPTNSPRPLHLIFFPFSSYPQYESNKWVALSKPDNMKKLIHLGILVVFLLSFLPTEAQTRAGQMSSKERARVTRKANRWSKRRMKAANYDMTNVKCNVRQSRRYARKQHW